MRFKFNKRAALLVAVVILCIWSILGTGATVAWFTDTGEVVQNDFAVGTLEMEVEYRNETMLHYEPVTQTKGIFNDGALYEPGYTQVVYLKITNTGDQPFDLRLSVDSVDWFDSISVLGNTLHLPDYLKFGVVFGDSEMLLERELARENAPKDFTVLKSNQYSAFDTQPLAPGAVRYAALVVYMPEEVGNAANYRGDQPRVELGITVFAQQAGTMEK